MAESFTEVTSRALALPQDDIDTDIIFPARFLLITDKQGLGRYAFYEWRFDSAGAPLPDSPLAPSRLDGAEILLAGANFGCGSSREHAPWALRGLGFRAIVAPSFGEIFRTNCFNNGILPVVLPRDVVDTLTAEAEAGASLTVDLGKQRVVVGCADYHFEIKPWRREALLNGWDEIETIRNRYGADIEAFERAQARNMPWLWAQKEKI